MRGSIEQTGALFTDLSPERLVPEDHPLRLIRELVNAALTRLSPEFARLYSPFAAPRFRPRSCCCKPSSASTRSAS
jgi:hypothetical protein